MKKLILYIFVSFALVASMIGATVVLCMRYRYYTRYSLCDEFYDVSQKEDSDEIYFMSFNIRGLTFDDKDKKSFFYRAPLLIKTIKDNEPDIICFQEVGEFELNFFKKHLLGYEYIVGYTTSGKNASGVVTAIRADRFKIVESNKFWLSTTPNVESSSWGSACVRVCQYTTILDYATHEDYVIANTHLDHVSEEARIKGAKLIISRMKALNPHRLILMGDMNDFVGEETYNYITSNGLNDAQLVASSTYLGPGATYHDYGRILNNARIDYFFVTPNITVNSYRVVDTTYDGDYPSDHFPIFMAIHEE